MFWKQNDVGTWYTYYYKYTYVIVNNNKNKIYGKKKKNKFFATLLYIELAQISEVQLKRESKII